MGQRALIVCWNHVQGSPFFLVSKCVALSLESLRSEYSGTSLIRTPFFAVPNALFVYNLTPEIRTPH